jgi:hypothetical protein
MRAGLAWRLRAKSRRYHSPKGRLVCAQGWRGGCVQNQSDTSGSPIRRKVKTSGRWYDTGPVERSADPPACQFL